MGKDIDTKNVNKRKVRRYYKLLPFLALLFIFSPAAATEVFNHTGAATAQGGFAMGTSDNISIKFTTNNSCLARCNIDSFTLFGNNNSVTGNVRLTLYNSSAGGNRTGFLGELVASYSVQNVPENAIYTVNVSNTTVQLAANQTYHLMWEALTTSDGFFPSLNLTPNPPVFNSSTYHLYSGGVITFKGDGFIRVAVTNASSATVAAPSLVVWSGGGADNLASNPLNWNHNEALIDGVNITFDSSSSKETIWDLGNITLKFVHFAPSYAGTVNLSQQMIVNETFNMSNGTLNTKGFNLTVLGPANIYDGILNATGSDEKFIFNNSLTLHQAGELRSPHHRTDMNGSIFTWLGGTFQSNGFVNGSLTISSETCSAGATLNVTDVLTLNQQLNLVSFDLIANNVTVTNSTTLEGNNSELTVKGHWNSTNGTLNEGRVHNFTGNITAANLVILNMRSNTETIRINRISNIRLVNSSHTGATSFDSTGNITVAWWTRANLSNATSQVTNFAFNVSQNSSSLVETMFSVDTDNAGHTNYTAINVTSMLINSSGSTISPNATFTARDWGNSYAGEYITRDLSKTNGSITFNITVSLDFAAPSLDWNLPAESNNSIVNPSFTMSVDFSDSNIYQYYCAIHQDSKLNAPWFNTSITTLDQTTNFLFTAAIDATGRAGTHFAFCEVSDG